MKKRFLSSLTVGAAFVLAALNACTNDMQVVMPEDRPTTEPGEVMFIANDFQCGDGGIQSRVELTPGEADGVKKATFAWAVGDTIGILPSDGAQVYFRINEIDEDNPKSATFTGGSWGLKAGEHNYAAYYPFIQDIMLQRTQVPVDYTTQTYTARQDGVVSPSHDYMAAKPVQRADGGLNFVFTHLGALVEAKFTLPEDGKVKQLTLVAESAVFPVKGTFDLTTDGTVAITPTEGKETSTITVQVEELTATADQEVSVFFMMPPMASVDVSTLKATVVYGDNDTRLPLDMTALKGPDGTDATQFAAQTYYTLETAEMEVPESIDISYVSSFSSEVNTALGALGVTKLRFVTSSIEVSETTVYTDANGVEAYAVRNGDWLEVHTLAKSFKLSGSAAGMFNTESKSNFATLTELDLTSFDTAGVTDMSYMFDSCSSLKELDLTSFNTEQVTNMLRMFHNCSSLTTLDLSRFNTEKVTNMGLMFDSCSSLEALDLSGFNTEQVTSMARMFYVCSSLKALDLSSFNTGKVTNMVNMFLGCFSLTTLDLSGFNTEQVTSMANMFYDCSSLRELDLTGFTFVAEGVYSAMFRSVGLLSYDSETSTKNAKIYVSQAAYDFLTATENIQLNYAALEVKPSASEE